MAGISKYVKVKLITAVLAAALIMNFSGCKAVDEQVGLEQLQTEATVYIEPHYTDTESSTNTGSTAETASGGSTSLSETTISVTSAAESETEEAVLVSSVEALQLTEPITTLQEESPSEIITSSETKTITEQTFTEATTTVQTTTVQTTSETHTEAPVQISYGSNTYNALNYREQKGIWISYLEYDSIMKNKSASSFRKTIAKYFDNIKNLSFNTVYVQVRAYGDAYYDSKLFPSGDRFNGTMGTSESYDALQIMIEEAHGRGLSVHAWINPMRLMTESQISALSDKFAVKQWYSDSNKNGKYIVYSGGRWYLNPAYKEVRQLIADGITEIVSGYDVDGVQIDDYFYPVTDASFDKAAYSASGTDMSLYNWRINNVNKMVKSLYKAVHNANSTVVFGISPQGSVENNYNTLYADVKTWCSSTGYCDYILPQVYFGFDNAALPYESTVAQWNKMVSGSGVKLVIGLAGYKIGAVDTYAGASGKNEWINNSDIISRQMSCAAELSNYGGVAIFRYGSVFEPASDVAKQVSKEMENIPR